MAQVIGTGNQKSGKNSAISIFNGGILAFASWDVKWSGDNLPTESFISGGFNEGIIGFLGLDYSAGGLWDFANNPFGNPAVFNPLLTANIPGQGYGIPFIGTPGIYPRPDLRSLAFFIDAINEPNSFWSLPYSRIISSHNSSAAKQDVKFDWNGMNQGVFAPPYSANATA